MINPILQMRKLRHRTVELMTPDHIAIEEQGWDMNGAVWLQNLFKIQQVYQNGF